MAPGNTLRFSYRLSYARTAAMLGVTLAVPFGLGYIASAVQDAHEPVRMFGVIALSPPEAAMFFWAFCAAGVVGALVALWIAFQNYKGPHHVELGPTAAVLPKTSVARIMLSVPYGAVHHIRTMRIPGQQMVIVDSSVGQSRLLSHAFATTEDFARFVHVLHERTRR